MLRREHEAAIQGEVQADRKPVRDRKGELSRHPQEPNTVMAEM